LASHAQNVSTVAPQLAVLDAHCHIDLYSDPVAVVSHAESLGIRTIAVTNAPSVFAHTRDLLANCRFARPAVGLHPELVHSHGHELELFWPFLEATRYVGEVGLDYVTSDRELRAKQRHVFSAIVEQCAARGDHHVLTIHSRRAAADVIATIGSSFPGKAILHWFSGSIRRLEQAVDAGFYFSVNTAMVLSKTGRTLVAAMPSDRVLTESDGPFVKVAQRPATPADTGEVVGALARTWHVQPHKAKEIVLSNLRNLLAESDRRA